MVDVVLIVAGVCPPETLESDGDGRQYPDEEEGLSVTDVEGKNAGCQCVSIAGG
jgi:hypothetical protein